MRLKNYIYVFAYLAHNLGDDLFLKQLFERYPHESFLIYDTKKYNYTFKDTKNAHFLHPIMWRGYNVVTKRLHWKKYTLENILASRCKAVVMIGGSMFIEPNIPYLRNDLFCKKPFFIIGVNFGPFWSNSYLEMCKKYVSEKTKVCFRDRASYQLFQAEGNTMVAPDVVFNMHFPQIIGNGIFISVMHFSQEKHAVILKYRRKYEEVLLLEIKKGLAAGERVTLGTFCSFEGDEEEANNLIKCLSEEQREKVAICNYTGNIDAYLQLINSHQIVVGTRFHSIVLGLLMGKRVAPISYSNKTEELLRDIGLAEYNNPIWKLETGNLKYCLIEKEKIENLRKYASQQFSSLDIFLTN